MLPVLSAEQMRATDAQTVARTPITSIDLMERAARACTDRLLAIEQGDRISYTIVAGPGNNGGDGLAIARILHESGKQVRVHLIGPAEKRSVDLRTNIDRYRSLGADLLEREDEVVTFDGRCDIVIDALFGTGLDRPVSGSYKDAIIGINAFHGKVVSVDMPSGLFAEDNAKNDPQAIVKADVTLTFECPKLALLLPENGSFVGMLNILPIGLDRTFIDGLNVPFQLIGTDDLRSILPERPRSAHKGQFGHALVIAGGPGMFGAAIMATRSALRSGVGLVTAHVPGACAPVLHGCAPEAMVSPDPGENEVSAVPKLTAFTAVGIGPGLGRGKSAEHVVKALLQTVQVPVVMDADALNLLAENPTWTAFLPTDTVLTPHPGEFDRLAGKSVTGYDRLMKAREWAMKSRSVLVLKGAYTAVIDPIGRVLFNDTGNPGMAKGGSGDVLTGLLTGLLAQRIPAISAALLAVHLHGLAGDLAAEEMGMDGMTAGDLVRHLPHALQKLRS
ncbi:MAG: NAD(P)H-hydrate dehydratase [Flavobacteriales bacterium]|nr:NAD(P)H-hydrate dehydratase [Flavobacteriales bacterium]MCB9168626.1 NAD(P)H-hydrate dehydratase [Flavobacteriales bacterium]